MDVKISLCQISRIDPMLLRPRGFRLLLGRLFGFIVGFPEVHAKLSMR